jgi:tetratricopeptide (TPR) repeat protein
MTGRAFWAFALIFLLALAGAGALFVFGAATAPDEQAALSLAAANGLYTRGEFALAADAYEQLAGQGVADASLYHNLGLAHAQLGDTGRALQSLETAYALAPRDPDVRAALESVQAQIVAAGGVPILAGDKPGLDAAAARLSRPWLTLDELSTVALALWIGLAALLLLLIFMRPGARGRGLLRVAATALGVLLFVAVLLLGARLATDLTGPLALFS